MSDMALPMKAARWRAWGGRTTVRLAFAIVLVLVFAAVFGPWISPYDPNQVELSDRLMSPDMAHWLGTDHLGRDILSRLIAGTRVSLGSVAVALAIILALGITIGGASGFIGGRIDQVIMRITDVFLTFPTLVLALFMIGMLGTGLVNVVIAIALSHWAWYARIVRGIVLSLRHREFLMAARLAGASRTRSFVEHLLPATLSQLLVLATLDIGHMMLHVAGLSFLGLGVTAPTAEWGVMISDARQFVWTAPMLIFWPGFALFISVMAFNILGDVLRDRLDPHLRAEHCH
ncbi:nickel ABC transporter permease subunit NikC [Afifella marina DSM 2698]|uniref:Nickel transport system permease protein n=2 Tax=Afifella marina TaxID=1080 RepID=A0A1G5M814_AFIMA|nr:nickel ABC transporter permease subunit NikC [Afifella marina DSM 2698]MBK1625836.1 nickel ABC transporter permease subunit NikC [Afifella marina]MBK5917658.1 nickel ABC transporter permease subunit NikC [Afifella marina]RAI23581.1 nickel ABC transporter permease subunit NikC [Afifella marina DSM 2698]SCZ21313.1 nickel transport system permease protein [Afifella marina DSM 2698]